MQVEGGGESKAVEGKTNGNPTAEASKKTTEGAPAEAANAHQEKHGKKSKPAEGTEMTPTVTQ